MSSENNGHGSSELRDLLLRPWEDLFAISSLYQKSWKRYGLGAHLFRAFATDELCFEYGTPSEVTLADDEQRLLWDAIYEYARQPDDAMEYVEALIEAELRYCEES